VDSTTLIRVISGCLFVGILVVIIGYYGLLSSILRKCSPASRTMQPGLVWLLLIPLVNLIWGFFVVSALGKSLANEFNSIGTPVEDPGKSIGIAMCICHACGLIPYVNFLTLPTGFVLWIIYWVKMAGFSRRLDQVRAGNVFQGI
jgi:hypothetical protein